MKANSVANRVIQVAAENGCRVDPLKLQKLLYYIQGIHLAVYNEPAFSDSVEAWKYGPVVRDVYERFRAFGSGELVPMSSTALNDAAEKVVVFVVRDLGRHQAVHLVHLTHDEPPWKEAIAAGQNTPLDHTTMAAFFRDQLGDDDLAELLLPSENELTDRVLRLGRNLSPVDRNHGVTA